MFLELASIDPTPAYVAARERLRKAEKNMRKPNQSL